MCRSGLPAGYRLCHSCAVTTSQVSHPVRHVVPVTLYRAPGPLWRLLRCYKDGPQPARGLLTVQLAAILGLFAARHLGCLAGVLGGEPDLVTSVPSTRPGRTGPHPLRAVIAAVPVLAPRYRPLLAPGPAWATHPAGPPPPAPAAHPAGPPPPAPATHPARAGPVLAVAPAGQGPAGWAACTGHNQAGDTVFQVRRMLTAQRALLIDDTFTTGARLQSAASALRQAGAAAVAGLVIGRVIWPGRNANCRRIWEQSGTEPFTFAYCCLCRPAPGTGTGMPEALPGN